MKIFSVLLFVLIMFGLSLLLIPMVGMIIGGIKSLL
jgi:hypothetical protein